MQTGQCYIVPLGDIMDEMGITSSEHDGIFGDLNGNQYYLSDWYIYSVKYENSQEIYSIIKMRTNINTQDKPEGVSVPFCEFDLDMLQDNYDYEQLGSELESITEQGISSCDENRIRAFFCNQYNPDNYFIAEVYLELIVKQDALEDGNTFAVSDDLHTRVEDLLVENDTIYDEESKCIIVSDVNNLSLKERQCLLATRAGTISYNAFAAEIIAHAIAAERMGKIKDAQDYLPDETVNNSFINNLESLLNKLYKRAQKADLGANEGKGEITDMMAEATYAYDWSHYVNRQEWYFGKF